MRALLVCPEFPLSFWSFQKSCQLRGNKTVNPPLGLVTVAALLPPEWELRLADLNTRSLTEEDWQWADLVLRAFERLGHQRLTPVYEALDGAVPYDELHLLRMYLLLSFQQHD